MEGPSGDLNVLLTQRSAELKLHAGQISFPGGRMERHDADIAVTALREAHEEVGIASDRVAVVGYLDPMPTVTGYAVTATIGIVRPGTAVEVDHNEVEYAFEVPLSFLVTAGNARLVEREVYGKSIRMVEYHYEDQRIWGATAMLIRQLVKMIK
jgi:8-oxo-dGTP pyrophosphatase MutT (NUDIX family)